MPTSVTFESDDTEKTFTFTAAADDADDDGDSVLLGFGALPDDVSEGSPGEATVSITDDPRRRAGGAGVVRGVVLHGGRGRHGDGDGGAVGGPGTRGGGAAHPHTRGATRPPRTTPACRPASPSSRTDTEKTFTFTAAADDADDDGDSVLLGFGTPLPADVTAGAIDQATVSITDNDDPAVTVSFGASSYSVAEGSTVTVTVELSAAP